jgi:CRISPR-associated endonuclease/helicase Cas3
MSTTGGDARRQQKSSAIPLGVLWAKSDAGGRPHSLIGHLLDAAAVAELIWDEFMAPITRAGLDEACDRHGRDILRLVAGWHDLGKASPLFQAKAPPLAATVAAAGYPMTEVGGSWHHTKAGAVIVRGVLEHAGARQLRWIVPLIDGHHGRFSPTKTYKDEPRAHGREPAWRTAQAALAQRVLDDLDLTLEDLACRPPALGIQIALAGFVTMADWIASSSAFPGTGTGTGTVVTMYQARQRARRAWKKLGLGPGWDPTILRNDDALFADRFGLDPRPLQLLVMKSARALTQPGLMVVEAPMGEGKTEAALAAAEILAKSFGCNGFVFAMPTQGTTDAMYARCTRWAASVAPGLPISLMHGKAMLNEDWRSQLEDEFIHDIDLDDDDPYGLGSEGRAQPRFAEWLLGRHRGLLSAGVVGTVDQILYAGSRTKYVSLRHAGLAGKVVIVDEVHSYDVYMGRFLHTLLTWCGSAGVPVVLMSATLPPRLRAELLAAYQRGRDAADPDVATPYAVVPAAADGYPLVTTVDPAAREVRVASVTQRRPDLPILVEVLSEDSLASVDAIADRAERELAAGGCALVILNTVARAQRTYAALKGRGVGARLLHGRLTAAARADHTAELVSVLGGETTRHTGRPQRLVVVATQIAEQSFDVDADVLITDLAPMDLLLQRIGRLHRHDRPVEDRPSGLARPRVVVTGVNFRTDGPPEFCPSFPYVYSRLSLLRSAARLDGGPVTWGIPSQVPNLVEAAYAMDARLPYTWEAAVDEARKELAASEKGRAALAGTFTLDLPDYEETLAGLHYLDTVNSGDEARVVRDGEPSREVALVRRTAGGYATLGGRPLGPTGERCSETRFAREVLGDTVRVRASERLEGATPLAAWASLPLLKRLDALVLDETGRCETDPRATYDKTLGLVIDRARPLDDHSANPL